MFVSKCLDYPLQMVPQTALPLAATLWLTMIATQSLAGEDGSPAEMYPDRTPGYVEEMLARDAGEIETGDTNGRSGKDQSPSKDWSVARPGGLNFVPLASDADERIDRFMEDFYPEPEFRFSVNSGGIGFAIDF